MKKILFFACLIPGFVFAQTDANPDSEPDSNSDSLRPRHGKLLRVISISAYMGGDFYRDGFEDRSIFMQAAPGSSMPYADLAGYSNSSGFFYLAGNTAVSNGLNVQFRLRPMPKYSELRFGLSHSEVGVSSQYYYKQSTTLVDTISMSNGDMLYVDSVSNSSYRYDWRADVIHLNAAFIVRSDPKRIFNFYTGIGLFGGIGFNGIVEMEHTHTSHLETYSQNQHNISYSGNYNNEVIVEERYRAPMFGSFGAYVPIGFNMRLGRRNNVFGHLALFGEYNGAIQFLVPKGVDPKARTVSSMYGGVRWYVHAPGGKGRERNRHRSFNYNRDQPPID